MTQHWQAGFMGLRKALCHEPKPKAFDISHAQHPKGPIGNSFTGCLRFSRSQELRKRIRTFDPQIISLLLYPTELFAVETMTGFEPATSGDETGALPD